MIEKNNNILIIKHSSLGDWIKASGFFKTIRENFPKHNIFFITAEPYMQLAYSSGYFDNIWSDSRKIYGSPRIFQKLATHRYQYVFDLQNSMRTKMYSPFIKYQDIYWSMKRSAVEHDVEQFSKLLKQFLNISSDAAPSISWLNTDLKYLELPKKFVLLIPGCNPKYPNKRWTASGYNTLIKWLDKQGIASVIIGSDADKSIIDQISNKNTINLINKIGFHGVASLARKSLYIIGSDTGPTHIAAATGAKVFALMSKTKRAHSNCKPWGSNVELVISDPLSELKLETLSSALSSI